MVKTILTRLLLISLTLVGTVGAFAQADTVFNKSTMATLKALGPRGSVTEAWVFFGGSVAVAVFSFILLLLDLGQRYNK